MKTLDSLPGQIIDLLNYGYTIIMKILEEQGEFFPIGVYTDLNGKTNSQLVFNGDDFPSTNVLMDQMEDDLGKRLESDNIVAYSIIYDARVTNKQYIDPIDVAIAKFESGNGNSTGNCFMPYQIIDGAVKFLEPWLE